MPSAPTTRSVPSPASGSPRRCTTSSAAPTASITTSPSCPDKECVVNKGNHSPRGGSNAQGIWSPYGPTYDRLQFPMVKVAGAQQAIPWEAAIEIMAATIGHAKETYGGPAMAIRFYAYQFYENTYPITKFYFGDIGTPNGAIHNRASMGGETTALSRYRPGDLGHGLRRRHGGADRRRLGRQSLRVPGHLLPGAHRPQRRAARRGRPAADLHRGLRRGHRRRRPSPARAGHRRRAGRRHRPPHPRSRLGGHRTSSAPTRRRPTTSPRRMPGGARSGRPPSTTTRPISRAWTPIRWRTPPASPASRSRRSSAPPS